jgi:hypothetical protein
MAVLARGSVTDRPWGMTLGALGNRALTGQLTLAADGKQYRIAFEQGAVVGAYSPMVNDAAVRVALTGNLITSSQVNELTRRLAAAPDRDEVDVIAELCRLGPDHAQRLRRRLVAQRAARTFSVDQGQFVVEDTITVKLAEGSAVDVRAVIFLGARSNLGEDRLAAELTRLGLWFKLKPEAIDDLPQYGFSDDEKPVLQMLVEGANVADVEARHAAIGARTVRAVTYALASCGACDATTVPQISRTTSSQPAPVDEARARTSSVPPQHARTSTIAPGSRAARSPSTPPTPGRASTTGNHASYRVGTQSGSHAAQPPVAAGSQPPATVQTGPRPTAAPPAASPAQTGSHPTQGRTPSPAVQQPRTSTQHKTAPLGSRAPAAGSEPPVDTQPSGDQGDWAEPQETTGWRLPSDNTGWSQPEESRTQTENDKRWRTPPTPAESAGWRLPTESRTPTTDQPMTPRTITESSGVPRATTYSNSSSQTSAGGGHDRSPSGGVAGQHDRSPSGGVAGQHDRSPSSGVARPPERASSSSMARPGERMSSSSIPAAGSSGGMPRAGSSTSIPRTSSSTSIPRTSSPTSVPRAQSGTTPPIPRTRTASQAGSPLRPPGSTRPNSGTIPPINRSRTGSVAPPMTMTSLRAPSRGAQMPRRPKQSTAATMEIEGILAKKIPMLERGVDYFTLFGLPVGAPPDDVRATYFMLARKLHPDRLSAIGVYDEDRHAQRVMACINEAFAVLNDPVRREEYLSILNRGGEEAVRAEEAKADELAMRVMRAEEEFRQGEMALRREQLPQAIQSFTNAVELAPSEPEYQAMLAWAKFAAAGDKQAIAIQTRKALIRAADANEESPTARFYLGRVERMLGREKEALAHFHEVLRIKPSHSEASSEARILEQRLRNRR